MKMNNTFLQILLLISSLYASINLNAQRPPNGDIDATTTCNSSLSLDLDVIYYCGNHIVLNAPSVSHVEYYVVEHSTACDFGDGHIGNIFQTQQITNIQSINDLKLTLVWRPKTWGGAVPRLGPKPSIEEPDKEDIILWQTQNSPYDCPENVDMDHCPQPIVIIHAYGVLSNGNTCYHTIGMVDYACKPCPGRLGEGPGTGIQPTTMDIQGVGDCPPGDLDCFLDLMTGKRNHSLSSEQSVNAINTYPNPFAEKTTISYTLDQSARVSIKIFDINGRLVAHLLDEKQQAMGLHQQIWQTNDLPKGIYYAQITIDNKNYIQKVMRL